MSKIGSSIKFDTMKLLQDQLFMIWNKQKDSLPVRKNNWQFDWREITQPFERLLLYILILFVNEIVTLAAFNLPSYSDTILPKLLLHVLRLLA